VRGHTVLRLIITVVAALGGAVVQANACGSHVAKDLGEIAAPASNTVIQKFVWPVEGSLEVPTCSSPPDRDYVNIAGPEGTIVRAAADGVVVYAGDELKDYGNLILIRHDDRWVTVYALNRKLLVKHGQQVRRGQRIARMGPLLHFELRRGVQPLDPLDYLPAMP
jgi:murein DD-endopeptidase MepM/ murein hydrolase activator NlpD